MKNQTSFKPGVVTNPKGAPKKEWTIKGLIEQAMEEQDESGVPYKEVVYRRLVKMASKGDMIAAKELNNRLEGQAKQSIDHDIDVNTIEVIIKDYADTDRSSTKAEGSDKSE